VLRLLTSAPSSRLLDPITANFSAIRALACGSECPA
jgi:hypothetical protein